MRDCSQNRKLVMSGPFIPVPVSPFWNIYDMWTATTVSVKFWDFVVPLDGMVYTLCNFTVASLPNGWAAANITLNGVEIFNDHNGYQINWSPGSEKGPKFKAGDALRIGIAHLYNETWNWYWQIDFFRYPV